MQNSNLRQILAQTDLTNYLDAAELDMLVLHGATGDFVPTEIILHQGKINDCMYFIIEGSVLVTVKLLSEGITQIESLERGNFIGEISFLEGVPCASSVVAKTEVKCLIISKKYFNVLSLLYPETKYKILQAITKQICYRLRNTHKKIADYMVKVPMTKKSIFGVFLESLKKPSAISASQAGVDSKQLHQLELFSTFTDEEKDVLLNHITFVHAPKNTTVIAEGAQEAICYIVLRGAVQTRFINDKKVAKLSVIGPITLFSSIACVDKSLPASVNFSACENTTLLRLTEEHLNEIRKSYPQIWFKLYDLICKSLVELERSIDKLEIRLNIEIYNRDS